MFKKTKSNIALILIFMLLVSAISFAFPLSASAASPVTFKVNQYSYSGNYAATIYSNGMERKTLLEVSSTTSFTFNISNKVNCNYLVIFKQGTSIMIGSPIASQSTYTLSPGLYDITALGAGQISYTLEINAYESVTIASIAQNSFLLKGNTYPITANITGSPTSVTAQLTDARGNVTNLGSLGSVGSGTYSLNYLFNTSTIAYDYNNQTKWPTLTVIANYSNNIPTVTTVNLCVTADTSYFYTLKDSSFYYNSPTSNSFIGLAGNYVCYDYAINYPGNSHAADVNVVKCSSAPPDPREGNNNQPLIDYMNLKGYTNGSSNAYPSIVYYSTYHFARVISWDTNGYPTKLASKFGQTEVLISNFSNSFYGGTATLYFK